MTADWVSARSGPFMQNAAVRTIQQQQSRPSFSRGWTSPLRSRPDLWEGQCASGRYPADWWTGSPVPRERKAAIALCGACPVLAECREWALAQRSYHDAGHILAGLTLAERDRRRKAAKTAVASRLEAQRR